MEPDFDFEAWLKKHTAVSDVIVPKWVAEVKAKYGKEGTKFACTGYCYGAPYVYSEWPSEGNWELTASDMCATSLQKVALAQLAALRTQHS